MPRLSQSLLLALLALAVVLGVGLQRGWGAADPQRAAGAMIVTNRTSASFEQPAAGLSPAELERHQVADGLFDRTHVPLEGLLERAWAPASTPPPASPAMCAMAAAGR